LLLTKNLLAILDGEDRTRKLPERRLKVTNFEEGLRIWNAGPVKGFFLEKSMKWAPQSVNAVFIPCSAWKPYPYSQSHKFGYLEVLRPVLDQIDLFVVSEPMGIVPYCYSDEYPIDSYDYDPYRFFIGKLQNAKARESLQAFIERVASWVAEFHNKYDRRILILPKSWHLKVYSKALEKLAIPLEQYAVIKMKGRPSNSVEFMRGQLQSIGLY
jgi:predicted RNA-binding protein